TKHSVVFLPAFPHRKAPNATISNTYLQPCKNNVTQGKTLLKRMCPL
ncbi:MAG: hypothetical protein ACJAQW_002025, partial [Paracoccaceae bacterium]